MNRKRWLSFRARYISKLVDSGITTAVEYADEFSDKSVDPADEEITKPDREALEEMTAPPQGSAGLRGFFRVYPHSGQPIMIVGANPQLNIDNFVGSDNHKLATILDMDRRENECLRTSYLHDSEREETKFRRQLAGLHDIDGLSDVPLSSNPEDISEDDLYFTNVYKMATTGEEKIPDWGSGRDSLAIEVLREEIRMVDPEIIVPLGGKAWNWGFRSRVKPAEMVTGQGKKPSKSVSDVAGEVFVDPEQNRTVVPIGHPTGPNVYDHMGSD